MSKFLALMLLVCALIVPRTAWDAHLAGHESQPSISAVHTHHADIVHEHSGPETGDRDASVDTDSDEDGLTHEHSPSLALSSAMTLPDVGVLPPWRQISVTPFDREHDAGPQRNPESLLRPPRAA